MREGRWLRNGLGVMCALGLFSSLAMAQLRVSSAVIPAGGSVTLECMGSGSTTLYLFGPGSATRKAVTRGRITVQGEELSASGAYIAVVDGQSAPFFVAPGKAVKLAFIARPSRVPAAAQGAVTGSAFVLDANDNLVTTPVPVHFRLGTAEGAGVETESRSHDGVAWVQMNSGGRSGAAQFTASIEGASVRRVVQQTASDPCALRMRASRAANGRILVETDPIKDCSGNAVPDGTIVTFTSVDAHGRSTVDARIKRGFAQAELPGAEQATLSVAAGVVMGNEIHWGGAR